MLFSLNWNFETRNMFVTCISVSMSALGLCSSGAFAFALVIILRFAHYDFKLQMLYFFWYLEIQPFSWIHGSIHSTWKWLLSHDPSSFLFWLYSDFWVHIYKQFLSGLDLRCCDHLVYAGMFICLWACELERFVPNSLPLGGTTWNLVLFFLCPDL